MLSVFRKELKYVMGYQEFAKIRPQLALLLHPDVHGSDFGYRVRSLYFDSVYDKDYYDTVDGLMSKGKIRVRVYDANSPIKLELKRKEGSDSMKYSLILTREEAEKMQQGDYFFLTERKEEVAQRIFVQLMQGAYQPKCLVEYDREAYTFPAGDVRVTYDTGTRATASPWDLFDEQAPLTPVIPAGTGVLEVKYSSQLPSFIKALVETDRLSSSNSKYVQSREFYQYGGDTK